MRKWKPAIPLGDKTGLKIVKKCENGAKARNSPKCENGSGCLTPSLPHTLHHLQAAALGWRLVAAST